MTDDIQSVREAYNAALEECSRFSAPAGTDFYTALAKRLQPRPEPAKKVWSVSAETLVNFRGEDQRATLMNSMLNQGCWPPYNPLNAIAPDIIRERPDLVAAEWERRQKEQDVRQGTFSNSGWHTVARRALFPELDP